METWKDIEEFIGEYQVSNLGNVRSLTKTVNGKNNTTRIIKGRQLKPKKDGLDKYLMVCLSSKGKVKYKLIHRLVAIAFVPNPDNLPEVNHKYGDTKNNKACDLEWCTRKYNIQHSYDMGIREPTILHRDSCHLTKIKTKDIPKLVEMKKENFTNKEIAKHFNMSESGIEKTISKHKHLIHE